jgi:hypothetical protein
MCYFYYGLPYYFSLQTVLSWSDAEQKFTLYNEYKPDMESYHHTWQYIIHIYVYVNAN